MQLLVLFFLAGVWQKGSTWLKLPAASLDLNHEDDGHAECRHTPYKK